MQGGGDMDLFLLPLEGERQPKPYVTNEAYVSQGRFSPDDHFVAYTSNASGRGEIYVRPFPVSSDGKWLVSKGGGVQPRWRRDGKELFYISPDSKMMAVDISTAPTFYAGPPKSLFQAPISGGGMAAVSNVTRYDVTSDGKKFLMSSVPSEANGGEAAPITVVLNWQMLLKK
jgi:Tol biopolymer transport system component